MSHVAFMYEIVHQKIIHDISSELLFQIMDSRCKTISTKMNIKHPQMNDVNISKAQPSKAKGLGGVRFPRSKNAALLYIYI